MRHAKKVNTGLLCNFGMERLRSWSGYRRHRTEQAYGCFLPDLTKFTADPCIGPDHDRSLCLDSVTDNGFSFQRTCQG